MLEELWTKANLSDEGVTELLCDYWDVSTGYTTSASFQPLLLAFEKIHYITVKSFFSLWNDSMEATVDQSISFSDDLFSKTPVPQQILEKGQQLIKNGGYIIVESEYELLHHSDFTKKL
ncbi:elmo ced-12 family protein [Rhizophagus clarus]|uniref:Elmo ced-12 family protein n=1 Tax=Rhizophagus clarus TaxID=94130 RepID=A0A8H3QGI9_9GLOM|nr:elmo ced-12 family protein [Rhizophagus clarus]